MNYEKKDWPRLPESMVADLLDYIHEADAIGGDSHGYGIAEAPEYLLLWIKEHLPLSDDFFVGVQRFVGLFNTPVHKDSIRDYCYNCVITADTATTVFYDEKLKVTETVKYGQNQWYYHNTNVFHKVTEMDDFRAAITVFKPLPDKVVDQYELSNAARKFMKAI